MGSRDGRLAEEDQQIWKIVEGEVRAPQPFCRVLVETMPLIINSTEEA